MKFDDDDPLDALVLRTAMSPPREFVDRVMGRLPTEAASVRTQASSWARLRETCTTLALAASALAGFSQVLTYVFGIWLATSAG